MYKASNREKRTNILDKIKHPVGKDIRRSNEDKERVKKDQEQPVDSSMNAFVGRERDEDKIEKRWEG